MKAKFFLLGLCALGLMACSIDEVSQVNDTNAIQFKATTATRAAAVTTNSIQEFTVWAWNDSNEFMDHVTATKQSNGTFTTSPYYFWPTGTVDFYALHPASVGYGVSETTSDELAYIGGEISIEEDDMGGTHYTYTGNVATADISEDNIVIEAYIPGTTDEQIDLCYAITKGRSSGAVPMNFRHALSQVVFKAKDINADFVVDIAEVSICSVNRYGKYTLSGVASTTDDITLADTTSHGVWSDWAHKTRFEASCTPQTLDTEGNVVDITSDPLLLIPQTVAAWEPLTDTDDSELGSYIRVLCHVTEHDSLLWPNENETSNTKTIDGVEYAYIAMPVDVDWAEGYRYTYTIIFGNGLGYYPPDDPNTDLEGTPVLVPITFNVTVDEFQDAKGVDVPTDTDLSTISVSTQAQLEGAIHSGYQEIVVTEDITLTDQIDVSYDLHLVLEANLTKDSFADKANTEMNYFFHVINNATLTIDAENGCGMASGGINGNDADDWVGCIVVGSYSSSTGILEYGHVIINSGSYYGGVWDANENCYNSVPTVYVMAGDAVINGGTFYGGWSNEFKSDGYKNESGWTENTLNCNDTPRKEGEAWIYVYGGTFRNFNPADNATEGANTNYCPEGYGVTTFTNADGNTWFTVVETKVASLSDFKDALTAEASPIYISGTIDWGEPRYTDTDLMITYDCTIVLEEGSVINAPAVGEDSNSAVFVIENGANVVIEGTGTVATDGTSNSCGCGCVWVRSGSKVTINSGTFKGGAWNEDSFVGSGQNTIYVQEGSATIYGGTFYAGPDNSFGGDKTSTDKTIINLHDSNRSNGKAAAYVYGGYFCDWDPADNNSEGANTNFVVDGYESVKSESPDSNGWYWYTVGPQN